ncbi:MAG: ABC transporter permease subunit [Defluviimonas sp.]|nr:ABC transporter permease subunit [Defluviimonas sp.]
MRLCVLGIVLAGLVLPIVTGLWQTGRAAFGHLPAVGAVSISLDPWRALAALPGLWRSVALSLWTGVGSTALSLLLALALAGVLNGRLSAGRTARLLAPALAAPHAAVAIGLAYVIAPSGWIARLLSPWATGWQVPPDVAIVHDTAGLSLILGLMVKEVPFFLLVLLSAQGQIAVRASLAAGRALGYGAGTAWWKLVVPQLYPLIRLPVFVVLSFALSVVDMAMLLGPSNPPTLAVAMTRWFLAAETRLILPASAAAFLLSGLVAAAIALWLAGERAVAALGRVWLRRGRRGRVAERGLVLAGAVGAVLAALAAAALASLLVWSVAWRWSFPDAWPESWSLGAWMRPAAGWGPAVVETARTGVVATLLSLALAIAWLESEDRAGLGRARWAEALIYLPLIVPQIAFLFGLSIALLGVGLPAGAPAVIWGHALFVFPYVMIALSESWRALDPRLVRSAAALGAGPWRRLVAVKLPVLSRPILTAAAIGFAVSVAQYLPTLFLGAGRVATLTTEAVTLASGSDRRITGVYAVLQAALPFAAYLLALLLPAAMRRRRGLAAS